MTCRHCHHEIPAELLACPACLTERSMADLPAQRVESLRLIAADGRSWLTVRRIGGVWHIQMFGRPRSYCGEVCWRHKYGRMPVEDLHKDQPDICEKCRAEVRALLQEAAPCSA